MFIVVSIDRCMVRENKQSDGNESEDTREARGYERPKTMRIRAASLNHLTWYCNSNITYLSRIWSNWTNQRTDHAQKRKQTILNETRVGNE
jgi:hypothetical protein